MAENLRRLALSNTYFPRRPAVSYMDYHADHVRLTRMFQLDLVSLKIIFRHWVPHAILLLLVLQSRLSHLTQNMKFKCQYQYNLSPLGKPR